MNYYLASLKANRGKKNPGYVVFSGLPQKTLQAAAWDVLSKAKKARKVVASELVVRQISVQEANLVRQIDRARAKIRASGQALFDLENKRVEAKAVLNAVHGRAGKRRVKRATRVVRRKKTS